MSHMSYQLMLAHRDDPLRDAASHRLAKQANRTSERAPGRQSWRWRGRHASGPQRVVPRSSDAARQAAA
jgi:hypothetical protein